MPRGLCYFTADFAAVADLFGPEIPNPVELKMMPRQRIADSTRVWPGVWLAALLLLGGQTLQARQDVYEARVTVPDRSTEARTAAVRTALSEVLVRLSGDPAVVSNPAGKALLADPSRHLQQYQYEGDAATGGMFLRAGFAAAPLDAALREQGLALWGRERTPVLTWVAVDDGQRRYLLGAEDDDPLVAQLRAAARRQNLELVLPLLDLEDQSKVTFTRVQEGDLDALMAASARYQPQAVLVGSLQSAASGWSGRWGLRHAGSDSQWVADTAPLATLLEQSLIPAAGRLVTRAPAPSADTASARVTVRIEGVSRLQDYARVDRYVRELPPVRRAELVAAQGQLLEYAVDVQGGAQGWARAVAAGALLEPVPGTAAAGASVYRLRP